MQTRSLPLSSHVSLQTHKNPLFLRQSSIFSYKTSRSFLPPNFQNSLLLPNSCLMKQRIKLATCCSNHRQEPISNNDGSSNPSVSNFKEEEEERKMEGLEKQSIWEQMKEIVMFTGPATGLWLCGPLMSLIDTAVIGQGSSLELAALGPGTVICDYTSYVFMFLSIATSNLVATSLARQLLQGPKNLDILPAANTYVQIRALAWPTVLVGWVAQSASLGMKDSWGPLKALAVASAVNGIGDIVLCIFLGYGIAGAAWATMVSQVVAAYMMIEALNKKGYNGFTFSVPSWNEVLTILGLAAPLFVAFWALVTYFATSLGTNVVAAHQVMIQSYGMCSVWGQPLSQTAQSFMPELIYGINRNLSKVYYMKQARILLSSLVIIGATLGLVLGIVGTSVPWFFPNIFTPDQTVIQEMHKVLIPYFIALSVSPGTHSLDGALLLARNGGYGLPGCWFALVGFQWARFFLNLQRLLSPDGVLYSEDMSRYNLEKLKEA
ncbi:hypothetical protein DKX38_006327 [Salix brachista]|uniref:Protein DETOXIFICATION n=1 Tax=Salix brachista TaxID=2182728 RepID=A0A5N5N1F7_9ROSI|nr:hypothetical protein DKX38_006327 [Salix brachista]